MIHSWEFAGMLASEEGLLHLPVRRASLRQIPALPALRQPIQCRWLSTADSQMALQTNCITFGPDTNLHTGLLRSDWSVVDWMEWSVQTEVNILQKSAVTNTYEGSQQRCDERTDAASTTG